MRQKVRVWFYDPQFDRWTIADVRDSQSDADRLRRALKMIGFCTALEFTKPYMREFERLKRVAASGLVH